MNDFRKLAHLREQLGDERFAALIDSANTRKVKEFSDGLRKQDTIPTELVNIGPENRSYDILSFLCEDENHVMGDTMAERAEKMKAHLGEDDGQYLLDNQSDIPASLRRKVVLVFTDWRHPDNSCFVCCVSWCERSRRWVCRWLWLDNHWDDGNRVLCRK